MKTLRILFLVLIAVNISRAQNVQSFEVKGLSCWSCANTATAVLKEMQGVDSAYVNFDTKKGVVYTNGNISQLQIKSAIASKNFEAIFKGEKSVKPLSNVAKGGLDIEVIKGGEKINFKKHLTERKITIFDFYADWCGPCRLYSPKLEHLLLKSPDLLSLKKVDVVDWKSNLAKQLTKEYKLPALPFTLIFDDKGKLMGRVEGNDVESVKKIITKYQQ